MRRLFSDGSRLFSDTSLRRSSRIGYIIYEYVYIRLTDGKEGMYSLNSTNSRAALLRNTFEPVTHARVMPIISQII